jgi:shikimate dehydrogenase
MVFMNKLPTLCISISKNPSNFGYIVHNAGYRELGLNYYYIPFKINDLKSAIISIRTLGIRGCGVSMPFKEKIIPLLDELDPTVKKIKSVNTIVNEKGILKGYNTDVIGSLEAVKKCHVESNDRILILGSGGVTRAILFALKKLNLKKIFVCSRNSDAKLILKKEFNVDTLSWEERNEFKGDFLINSTPIGMNSMDKPPIVEETIKGFGKVMDVVVSHNDSKLIEIAKKNKSEVSDGKVMSLYQAAEQFRLYTGIPAPINTMKKAFEVYQEEI